MQLLNADNLKKMQKYQHAEAAQLMWDFAHDPEVSNVGSSRKSVILSACRNGTLTFNAILRHLL